MTEDWGTMLQEGSAGSEIIPESMELVDQNGDGIADGVMFQEDTNGDGVADTVTLLSDSNGDGYIDTVGTGVDTNGDGVIDSEQLRTDTNGDGRMDTFFQQSDSDGDGVFEYASLSVDGDGDGAVDFRSSATTFDTNGDGVHDTVLYVEDADGDGTPETVRAMDEEEWASFQAGEPQEEPLPDNEGTSPEGYGEDTYGEDSYYYEGYEQYDPSQSDPSKVVGDPAGDEAYWAYQGENGPCAIYAQVMAYEAITGEDVDPKEMIEVAEENGWYNGGTSMKDIDKILDYLGAETEYGSGGDLEDLADCLEDGGRIVVAVDANEIWYSGDSEMFAPNEPNHAVTVVGIDYSGEEPMVIVNDSGIPDGHAVAVPADRFMDAWEDSGYTYVEAYA